MTNDDLLYRHRLLVFARAAEIGVSRACQALGYHRSRFYRWKGRVEREGLEVLRPRERRAPRMPNQIPPWQEKQILAMALANPGLGPRRLAAQLAFEQPMTVSASGVLRVLRRRHGLGTRLRRLEECWRPTFAMSLVPKYKTLRRDLVTYLRYNNFHRAHTGQRSTGRPPAELVYGSRKCFPHEPLLSRHLGRCST